MDPLLRRACAAIATLCCAVGLIAGAPGLAYAATVYGQNCAGGTWETRGPLGAACTANFNASRPGTARMTLDIIPGKGDAEYRQPHKWSFDVNKCSGTLMPADPPRTFTCDFGPGPHTVYLDYVATEKVVLRVDY